jgi:hypothetical protein
MNDAPKYVAKLSGVREVSLFGTADLGFWKDRLHPAGLVPEELDARARILISASDARFMGLRFGEFSVSVLTKSPDPARWRDAAYLLHAFNSRRFFAFCERAMYSTPYYHGRIDVEPSMPAWVELRVGGEAVFRAAMKPDAPGAAREPSRIGEESWEGPIFLPARGRGRGDGEKLFFAQISGHTRAYPFVPVADELHLRPCAAAEVFQSLIDSKFSADEWIVREDAIHAKSKTYLRSTALRASLSV